MNRKDLEKKYNIIGDNNNISLYRKQGEFTHSYGYCGNVKIACGKVSFNRHCYTDIESLDNALREWGKSLPWPVDTYNPMMRKGAVLEDRVIWFLMEKMGFKQKTKNWRHYYAKNIGPNCEISFDIERAEKLEDEFIMITSTYGGYYFTGKYTDVNEAVAMVSSIVKQEVLQMSSDMVDALSRCPDVDVPNIDAYVKDNTNIFGFKKADFKSTMIALLESELKKLKED